MSSIVDEARATRLQYRYLTPAGVRVAVAVAEGEAGVAVTWARAMSDGAYGVTATPGWETTVWVTDKSATGCTVNFGAAAPSGGGTVDLTTFRED